MKNAEKIDKNFSVKNSLNRKGIKFYDCEKDPFSIHGVFKEGDLFVRMPREKAKTVNEGVYTLCSHTTGGRVRFRTDSAYVAVNCTIGSFICHPHMPLTGAVGFDLYADGIYRGTFIKFCLCLVVIYFL